MKKTCPKTAAGKTNRSPSNSLAPDLRRLRVGRAQVFRQIAVYPLVGETNGGPDYLTMAAALDSKVMEVTEIDEDGSVPELMVRTHSPLSILIIDGEELIGAKQNRVVNSTILLNRQAETKIPVSCTEAGRWAYKSANFASSDVVMERKARARKSHSVKQSLQSSAGHASDQSGVWDDIAELSAKACAPSPTSAMKDVFDQRRADIAGV